MGGSVARIFGKRAMSYSIRFIGARSRLPIYEQTQTLQSHVGFCAWSMSHPIVFYWWWGGAGFGDFFGRFWRLFFWEFNDLYDLHDLYVFHDLQDLHDIQDLHDLHDLQDVHSLHDL